jgi:hypothetical protein
MASAQRSQRNKIERLVRLNHERIETAGPRNAGNMGEIEHLENVCGTKFAEEKAQQIQLGRGVPESPSCQRGVVSLITASMSGHGANARSA